MPSASRTMSLKFAANLNFLFTEAVTIAERLKLAHKNGFRAVEMPYPDGEIDDVIKAKVETGIEVVLVNLAFDKNNDKLIFGSTSIPGEEVTFKEQLTKTINFAKAVSCEKIHITAGVVKSEPESKHLATYKTNLKLAASHLANERLTGVIEPINKYAIPSYFLNSYEKAQDVLNEVNSEHIKLMVDVYHLQHICGNVSNLLKEVQNSIGHIQVAQVPGRNEPDTSGELNYSYVFDKIKESGYNGWIGCEYKPKTTTAEGLKWLSKYGLEL